MDLCLIWAQDRAGATGRDNKIPWHVPEDMRHFRELTLGCPVIMGRRTWEAIGSKALPGRQNIVLLRENDELELPGAVRAATSATRSCWPAPHARRRRSSSAAPTCMRVRYRSRSACT